MSHLLNTKCLFNNNKCDIWPVAMVTLLFRFHRQRPKFAGLYIA